jgi:choline monooxygenase
MLPHSGGLAVESLRQTLAQFDPTRPLERAETLPASWYWHPEVAELERRAVFQATWQPVGLAHQVATAGSYLTADVVGEPVAVVRDLDGTLRAFANVCRHRGARVLQEPCGAATRLRCRYHGWTYDLAGQLRGVPEFDGVQDFRREDHGLPMWPVAVWGPFVWVHLGTPTDLAGELAEPTRSLTPAGFESLRWVERREYELACNWKVFVDNYLDGGYHINTVHPGLAGVIDYAQYRAEVYPTCSVQLGPLRPPDLDDPVARVRSGTQAQYWWVYPNLMVNLTDGVMDTNVVLPLGVERCRVIFDFYFASTDPAYIAESIAVGDQVQVEDMGICAEVQRGLVSRAYRAGRFSVKREGPGYAFHQLLGRRLVGAIG